MKKTDFWTMITSDSKQLNLCLAQKLIQLISPADDSNCRQVVWILIIGERCWPSIFMYASLQLAWSSGPWWYQLQHCASSKVVMLLLGDSLGVCCHALQGTRNHSPWCVHSLGCLRLFSKCHEQVQYWQSATLVNYITALVVCQHGTSSF